MIRAVIDTNLLVRYALTQGKTLSRLLDHWQQGTFMYLTSPQIIAELKDVLQCPKIRKRMTLDTTSLIVLVEKETFQTSGELIIEGVCRDPKDDIFIVYAIEGKAHFLVSDNKDLLDIGEYQGINIVRPELFVAFLDSLNN